MRVFLSLILVFLSLGARADAYSDLYQAAGWPQQRAHFSDALGAAQQRYRSTLPPAVYQTLVENSNRRFAPQAMDQRAIGALRQNLPNRNPRWRSSRHRWGARSSPPSSSPPAATNSPATPTACRRSRPAPPAGCWYGTWPRRSRLATPPRRSAWRWPASRPTASAR